MTDPLLGLLIVLLVVGIVGVALWPPHHHRYIYLVGQQVTKGKSFQITQCVCGAQRREIFPKPDEENSA